MLDTAPVSLQYLLTGRGPCTGSDLLALTGGDSLRLWKTCRTQPGIVTRRAGRRYLRLDKAVEGYARLSPSIQREFLTYTVIGTEPQTELVDVQCLRLQQEFVRISQQKRELALTVVRRVVESHPDCEWLPAHFCCLIAGDVTYGMAHAVERPEPSTGRPVRGSDLDLVIVSDGEPSPLQQASLDEALYREKWALLALPQVREEIDYVVKDLAKVTSQLQFDTFRHMVACKILHEGELLYGSADLFARLKRLLAEAGIPERLALLEDRATQERNSAEAQLAASSSAELRETWQHQFFTTEEREEFC